MWERSAIVGYTVVMNWRSSRRDGAAKFNKPAHYWFGGFMLTLGCVVEACCCGDVRRMGGKLRVLLVDSRQYILADRVCSIRCNLLQSWFPSDALLLSHCRICSRSRKYYFPARTGPLYLWVDGASLPGADISQIAWLGPLYARSTSSPRCARTWLS